MDVEMRNATTGDVKRCKVGKSWTALFWGSLVPLYRKDWAWGVPLLLTQVIFGSMSLVAGLMVNVVLFGIYNQYYIEGLTKRGYRRVTTGEERGRNANDL